MTDMTSTENLQNHAEPVTEDTLRALGERCWNACCLQEEPPVHDTYPFAIWDRCNLLEKEIERLKQNHAEPSNVPPDQQKGQEGGIALDCGGDLRISEWADEWIQHNFGPGIQREDLIETSAEVLKSVIAVAFFLGRGELQPSPYTPEPPTETGLYWWWSGKNKEWSYIEVFRRCDGRIGTSFGLISEWRKSFGGLWSQRIEPPPMPGQNAEVSREPGK